MCCATDLMRVHYLGGMLAQDPARCTVSLGHRGLADHQTSQVGSMTTLRPLQG